MHKEESLGYNLGVVHNLMCRAISKDIDVKKYPTVSPIQIKILKYLFNHQDQHIYQKDIETLFSIRRSTVSGVLKTMEKNKMIMRVDNPNDARSKETILTDNAKKHANIMHKKTLNLEKILDKNIEPDELKIFIRVLNTIQTNLKDYERNNKND